MADAPRDAAQWWEYARCCAYALWAGETPPKLAVHGPVLAAGESAILCAPAFYSRYLRGGAAYTPVSTTVIGRPTVVVGSLVVQGLVNHRRRLNAEREAAQRWRAHQRVAVIVTSHRLLCSTREHGWQPLWFRRVTEFYPDLENWSMTVNFGHDRAPLRLTGPAAPALILWSAWGIVGKQWVSDPRLASLLEWPAPGRRARQPGHRNKQRIA
jgi:hypothetical protein